MKDLDNLQKLSVGEHSLKEVLELAGLGEEKKTHYLIDGRHCSICGNEVLVEFDEDQDETGFRMLPYPWCDHCQKRVFIK